MALKNNITDGTGADYAAQVLSNNALKVQSVPESSKGIPPEELANLRLFRGFLENGGSADANVDGSTTSVNFTIESQLNRNLWVTSVRFLFEDRSLEMNTNDFRRFGTATTAGTALTNGLLFQAEQGGESVELFADPIGFMGDFFTYADDYLNLINSVGTQEDFLSFDLDFEKPVVLAEGGSDSLRLVVQDDLTAIDKFQVLVRGYQEFTS